MKTARLFITATALILMGLLCGTGCNSGGGGGDEDYFGTWKGVTSNGGTVNFVVNDNVVTSLKISDSQADVWSTQLVPIEGNGFNAETPEGFPTPTSPAVSVYCTFISVDQASGTYSVRRGGRATSGTFEAAKQ